jgi:uncharacterized protein YkwD
MILKKISNTLLKGILLFVLTISPTINNDPTSLISYNSQPSQTANFVTLKNDVSVSASDKNSKKKLQKNKFVSYICNEDAFKPLLIKINKLREENNISKTTLDGRLNAVACAHTKWMLKNQKFGHRGHDDTGFVSRCEEASTRCTDESVLKDIENDFVSMFTKAIEDANTKEKLLDPDNKNIGFAFEQGVLTVIYR